jgi:Ca2+-binding RTX toxin-like protein
MLRKRSCRQQQQQILRRATAAVPFEALEQRRMMSASLNYVTHLLTVTGTSGNDVITVTQAPVGFLTNVQVWENNVKTYDSPFLVTHISIDAGDGSDIVAIDSFLPAADIQGGPGDDRLFGGDADDYIDGWTGNDELHGGAGDDQLLGYSGNEYMYGDAGNDQLWGEYDNDVMDGGTGADLMYGGSGTDEATYNTRLNAVNVSLDGVANDGEFNAVANTSTELDNANADIENVRGGNGNDRISSPIASVIANSFWGGSGNDQLYGGGGADVLDAGMGNDTSHGDGGDDNLTGGFGSDWLYGDDGFDQIRADQDNDYLYGGAGMDNMDGGGGADYFAGGADMDTADYSGRTVPLNISLDGTANDGASGEIDNVNSDVENVNGGSANDTITSPSWTFLVNVFQGNGGNDVLDGGGSDDVLMGGAGNDQIRGNSGNDDLAGGSGDDVIFGAAGNDIIHGDDGNDRIYGGADADVCYGGNNNDQFVLVGGDASDHCKGESGFDSYWLDSDASEVIEDAPFGVDFLTEMVSGNVHRIASFTSLNVDGVGTFSVSKELNGQNIVDPTPNMGDAYMDFTGNPLFASGGPSKDDIDQEGVPDCWFMATLSAVAKMNANRIRQSVCDLGDGTYAVRFWDGSTQKYYRVDHQLAPGTSAGLGTQNSMWVPIMEKALCFFRRNEGTYASAGWGWPEEAFNSLGIQNVDADDDGYSIGDLAIALANNLSQGRAVVFCTPSSLPMGSPFAVSHCYLVDSANRDSAGNLVSFTLRNPWGPGGPNGYLTVNITQLHDAYRAIHSAIA